MVDKGEGRNILHLDHSKAFDTTHSLKKLGAVSVTTKILFWIGSLSRSAQQRVISEDVCYSWSHVRMFATVGVM